MASVVGCNDSHAARSPHRDPIDQLPVSGPDLAKLRIGISPGTGMESSAVRAMPLRDYLESALRHPVELVAAPSYDELIGFLERGSIDVAILSPLTYVRARRRLQVVPLAAASSDGSPTYSGYLVVRNSSSLNTLADLRQTTIAWVDSTSTSGYLYPRALLRYHGHDPDRFFGRVVFAGDHWSAIRMVARGEADVGAVASSFVDPGRTQRIAEADELRVVAKTARIPYDCVVVLDRVPRAFARRLRASLLRLQSRPDVSARLAATWGFSAFVTAYEHRYDAVAEVHQVEHDRTEGTTGASAHP